VYDGEVGGFFDEEKILNENNSEMKN